MSLNENWSVQARVRGDWRWGVRGRFWGWRIFGRVISCLRYSEEMGSCFQELLKLVLKTVDDLFSGEDLPTLGISVGNLDELESVKFLSRGGLSIELRSGLVD